MANVKTKISIPGFEQDKLPFDVDHISISESFDSHHNFELVASLTIGRNLSTQDLEKILGTFVTIEVTTKLDLKSNAKKLAKQIKNGSSEAVATAQKAKTEIETHKFIGITDNISLFQQGDQRMIRIEGYSPTILMDGAPEFRVFSEMKVSDIASNILRDYKGIPSFPQQTINGNENVTFSVQTQETDYRFLCRLADQHGYNFFYDGEKLNFEKIKSVSSNNVELNKSINLFHFRASVNLSPIHFKVRGYNHLKNEMQEKENKISEEGNPLVKTAIKKSRVYPKVSMGVPYCIDNENSLSAVGDELATRQSNSMVTVSGGSSSPKIKVGSVVEVKSDNQLLPGFDKKEKFRVLSVTHSISNGGDSYNNSFVAIPESENRNMPVSMSGAKAKISGPLMAEVINTNDPDKLGRVQVKFLLDKNISQNNTPWLRVLVPFSSNGGHFFLPEIGEKVVVFFEDFNIEKSPFVMGSFFDKAELTEKWSDSNNKKKGICTGAISLLFDENTGKLSINAKSIEMITQEGITMDGGSEIKQQANNINIDAKQKTEVAGKQGVKVKGARIDLN